MLVTVEIACQCGFCVLNMAPHPDQLSLGLIVRAAFVLQKEQLTPSLFQRSDLTPWLTVNQRIHK